MVHLVGFTVEVYYVARPYKSQVCSLLIITLRVYYWVRTKLVYNDTEPFMTL